MGMQMDKFGRSVPIIEERKTPYNIVYKALGFKWLNQAFCPACAFVSADRNGARNPQRFIHATVSRHCKKNIHYKRKRITLWQLGKHLE